MSKDIEAEIPDVMILANLDTKKEKMFFIATLTEVLHSLQELGLKFDEEHKMYFSIPKSEEALIDEMTQKIVAKGHSIGLYKRADETE